MDEDIFGSPALILDPTCTETDLYFSQATARHPVYVRAVDTFIRDMKRIAYWSFTDALYCFAAPDQASAFINIKNPGTNTCTIGANTVTHTPWGGLTTDGVSGYVDTNWNFTAAGNNYVQDLAGVWVYHGSNSTSANSLYGWNDGTDGVTLLPKNASGFGSFRINQAALTSETVSPTLKYPGVYNASRTGTTTNWHGNFSADGTVANGFLNENTNPDQTSTAPNNATFNIGRTTAVSFGVANIKFLMIGGYPISFTTSCSLAIIRFMQRVTQYI
jgi:hypothetical protein